MFRKMRWVAHGSSDMLWCVWYLVVHFSFNWIGFNWINLNTSVPCPHRFAEQLARPFLRSSVLIALTEAGLIDLAQLPAKALGPTALLPTALAVEAVRPQAGGKLQSPNCHRGFLWNNLKFKVSTVRGLHGLCDYVNVDPRRSMMNHVMQEVYSWFCACKPTMSETTAAAFGGPSLSFSAWRLPTPSASKCNQAKGNPRFRKMKSMQHPLGLTRVEHMIIYTKYSKYIVDQNYYWPQIWIQK